MMPPALAATRVAAVATLWALVATGCSDYLPEYATFTNPCPLGLALRTLDADGSDTWHGTVPAESSIYVRAPFTLWVKETLETYELPRSGSVVVETVEPKPHLTTIEVVLGENPSNGITFDPKRREYHIPLPTGVCGDSDAGP